MNNSNFRPHTLTEVFSSPNNSLTERRSLSIMAENEELNQSDISQLHQSPSSFLEIYCTSSGKTRRYSVGTEASFALKLINKKLSPDIPSASYIEAVKEGEESICFGPNSVLIDYGTGWRLQTVTEEGSDNRKDLALHPHNQFAHVNELTNDNVGLLSNVQLQLENPLQLVKPGASEIISDLESQSDRFDLTDTFTTNAVFDSRDELIQWTRDVGRSVGTVIVIKKSGNAIGGRAARICFGCERGGKYRVAKRGGVKVVPIRQTGSKKCQCPFTLRGVKLPKDDQWMVKVECGFHNHPLNRHPEGHSYCGKLSPDEEAVVMELSKSGLKPKDVLTALKERNQNNASTMHTIYCARQKLKLTKKFEITKCNSC